MRNKEILSEKKWKFGKRLEIIRIDVLRLNQDEMAELIGANRSMYQRWEAGESEPGVLWLAPLIRRGVQVDWLISGNRHALK